MPIRPRFHAGWLLPAALLATVAGSASAAPPAGAPARPAIVVPAAALASHAPAAPVVSGLVAFLDPETGLLTGPVSAFTPPADQRAAAVNVLLEEFPLPGGGWVLDLKGTMMESYVLTIDALGGRQVSCVQDTRAALGAPVRPAVPARKER